MIYILYFLQYFLLFYILYNISVFKGFGHKILKAELKTSYSKWL